MISGSHHYSIQGPKMPKKIKNIFKKKKQSKKEKEEAIKEMDRLIKLGQLKMEQELRHERRMAKDLDRLINSWNKDSLPKDLAVEFSAFYMVNFIFECRKTEDANHLLITAIARQLIQSYSFKDTETTLQ